MGPFQSSACMSTQCEIEFYEVQELPGTSSRTCVTEVKLQKKEFQFTASIKTSQCIQLIIQSQNLIVLHIVCWDYPTWKRHGSVSPWVISGWLPCDCVSWRRVCSHRYIRVFFLYYRFLILGYIKVTLQQSILHAFIYFCYISMAFVSSLLQIRLSVLLNIIIMDFYVLMHLYKKKNQVFKCLSHSCDIIFITG